MPDIRGTNSLRHSPKNNDTDFLYKPTGVILGKGKSGPVELIIVKNKFKAMKRISKYSLGSDKMLQHLINEKNVLMKLKSPYIVKLEKTL